MEHAKIQLYLYKTEFNLSKFAAIPIIGIIPSITKVALGILEIFGGTYIHFFNNTNDEKLGINYIKHGAYNILAGFLEAVPLLGTLIFYTRFKHRTEEFSLLKSHNPTEVGKYAYLENDQSGLFKQYSWVEPRYRTIQIFADHSRLLHEHAYSRLPAFTKYNNILPFYLLGTNLVEQL